MSGQTFWIAVAVAAVVAPVLTLVFAPVTARARVSSAPAFDLTLTFAGLRVRPGKPQASDSGGGGGSVRDRVRAVARPRNARLLIRLVLTPGALDLASRIVRRLPGLIDVVAARGRLEIGLGSPRLTAELFAVVALLEPALRSRDGRYSLEIAPNLGGWRLFGAGEVVLRTRLWRFVSLGLSVVVDPAFWRVKRLLDEHRSTDFEPPR